MKFIDNGVEYELKGLIPIGIVLNKDGTLRDVFKKMFKKYNEKHKEKK